ncbi:MAG: diguanylate cyclase [Clostridia bacterium]
MLSNRNDKAILDNLPVAYSYQRILYDQSGNPIDFEFMDGNGKFLGIAHVCMEDLPGKKATEVLPGFKDVLPAFLKRCHDLSMDGGSDDTFLCRFPDGVSYAIHAYSDQKGHFGAFFLEPAREFSADRTMELDDARRALQESQEKLKITLLSVGDAIISTDIDGNIEMINHMAEKLTGWPYGKAMGRSLDEVFHVVHEDTGERYTDMAGGIIRGDGRLNMANPTILIAREGRRIPIKDSAAAIKDEKGCIRGCVIVFRDFSEEKTKQERIRHLSYHDELTGLYNRRFYEEELKRLDTKRNLPISIIMGDANGLKLVNDTFGHAKGDELLLKVAEKIKQSCRADDIIARWGGDEFVVLLPRTGISEAEDVISRIKGMARKENVHAVNISISFGWAVKENQSQNIMHVLKEAEDLMYRNKTMEGESERGSMINTMQKTLHEKNPREERHSVRVSETAQRIGEAMRLPLTEIHKIRAVGLLHDIGKIAFDDRILMKNDIYVEKDYTMMKRHPEIGYRILNASFEMRELAEYVLYHHEWYNGNGYPKGLSGEEIPLISRIIAIADAFDAMTEYRPYRTMMQKQQAAAQIQAGAGSQFDPGIVEVFISSVLGEDR